jgi:hypothetical protein
LKTQKQKRTHCKTDLAEGKQVGTKYIPLEQIKRWSQHSNSNSETQKGSETEQKLVHFLPFHKYQRNNYWYSSITPIGCSLLVYIRISHWFKNRQIWPGIVRIQTRGKKILYKIIQHILILTLLSKFIVRIVSTVHSVTNFGIYKVTGKNSKITRRTYTFH